MIHFCHSIGRSKLTNFFHPTHKDRELLLLHRSIEYSDAIGCMTPILH